jgi:hypothetical protein
VTTQAPPATATLEVDPHTAAPIGVLQSDFGLRVEFTGWVELAAAIEEWRGEARKRPHAERPGRNPAESERR